MPRASLLSEHRKAVPQRIWTNTPCRDVCGTGSSRIFSKTRKNTQPCTGKSGVPRPFSLSRLSEAAKPLSRPGPSSGFPQPFNRTQRPRSRQASRTSPPASRPHRPRRGGAGLGAVRSPPPPAPAGNRRSTPPAPTGAAA